MSFLPYASPSPLAWLGSLGVSVAAHGALAGAILFSGAALLPEPQEDEIEFSEIAVSLEILDADLIEEVDPFDLAAIPEDAIELAPEELEAEDFTAAEDALAPEDDALLTAAEPEALAPDVEEIVPEATEPEELVPEAPAVDALAALEPDILAPEPDAPLAAEPEVVTPEPVLPEALEPEIVEPVPEAPVPEEPVLEEPEIAEPVLEEPAPEPVIAEPVIAEPVIAEPLIEEAQPFVIDDISPIEETVLNPLADGSGGALAPDIVEEPAFDDLALGAPEPALPDLVAEPEPLPLVPETPETPEVAAIEPEVIEEEDLAALEPELLEVPEPPAAVPEPVPVPVEEEALAVLEPEAVAEPEPTEEPAPVAEAAAPARPPLVNPSASDIALGNLIRRIRALPSVSCTLALPRRAGGAPEGGLTLVGADEAELDDLSLRIGDGLDADPIQTRDLVDTRQCATLDALRQSADYPVSRLGLALDGAVLTSGDTLTARVLGAGGLFLTLLVVDDNGVVQDLAPFTTLDGDTPVVEVPVARAGPTRTTRQILLALATPEAPLDLSGVIGELAQDVFSSIPPAQLEAMSFAVATFDVR
ncbi:MAG: hypothetical protein AAFP13_15580 [Pseudomonadota bacterium]